MKYEKIFRQRLTAIRKAHGLTQFELAEKIGRAEDTISQIERGRNAPNLETLILLSEALRVPLSDFIRAPEKKSERECIIEDIQVALTRIEQESDLKVILKQINAFVD